MSLKYYPNRVIKSVVPAIDRVMAFRDPVEVRGRQDLASGDLDVTISEEKDWQLNSIMFTFSTANARDYSAKVKNGRKVVTDINDYLWFQTNTTLPQKITLDPGFYNGTQLGAELSTQLNANTVYSAAGITFVVTYNENAGTYSIAISPGHQLIYLDVNTQQVLSERDSIAGHLFGLNASTSFAAGVTSDTLVYGLNEESAFISQTAGTVLEHYHDDIHILTVDQSVHIEATNAVGACVVNWTASYEKLV